MPTDLKHAFQSLQSLQKRGATSAVDEEPVARAAVAGSPSSDQPDEPPPVQAQVSPQETARPSNTKAPRRTPGRQPEPSRASRQAKTDPGTPAERLAVQRSQGTVTDGDVQKASCATCGGYHSSSDGSIFHSSMGCADGQCVPGQASCTPPANECDTVVGAFISNLYQILNCNDPCYQPHWEPAAYASVFADYARPRTVTRIRYDNLINIRVPDRNQFFIQQTSTNFPKHFTNRHGVTYRADPSANMQQLYLYQEAAGAKGSFFVEIPYRQLNPLFSPTQAGFSDINFGVKSMLLDTELLQVTFQFRTYTPSGNGPQGLGTGHFSLDPSLMSSLKLAPDTYFQSQLGNWVPLGGNQNLTGGVLYWFMSLNQVLYRLSPDSPLIGMIEMDGWSFENGGYTNPIVNKQPAIISAGGGVSYFNVGPGLRLALGNAVDVGSALTFATTPKHWGSPWFRLEVRFLF